MEDNFAVRLKLFMDSIGIQSSQFADLCGIPRPSFSQLLSGRNQKVSDSIIKKIHDAFPDLSIMWLMFGEGDMTVAKVSANTSESDAEEIATECDNENLLRDGRAASEYANLNALTTADMTTHNAILQQLEESKKIMELQMQIENLQKNPRRVTQITVYYDDSTFETFLPSK